MQCPNCGNLKTEVKETRTKHDKGTYTLVWRRRRCRNCYYYLYTEEKIHEVRDEFRKLVVIRAEGEPLKWD